jgi:TolB-like protein/Tfp pilus assembly protein PilF
MDLPIGARVGAYEILGTIGVGGMGTVYRARDLRLGRDVALKFCSSAFGERFMREARAIAALNHPNVCQLYDIGEDYLVMELVEGAAPRGPLPLPIALDYARQLSRALEAAHEKGIVHRDLKPANIRITPDGVLKVLDFGLAKLEQAEGEAGGDADLTVVGTRTGTAAYMAPEQVHGKVVDKRADIWAFGVVLYELLTGENPFRRDSAADTLAAVLTSEPSLERVPAQLRPLLARCLARDPRQRLRDIGDAMTLIEAVSGVQPTVQPEPPRRAYAAAAAVVLAIVTPVLIAVALFGPWRSPSEGEERTASASAAAATASGGPTRAVTAAESMSFSIAVLPFESSNASAEDAEFAAGLHDQLHNQLTKIRSLTVTSRSSVLRYGQNPPPIREIAAELRVAAVMESSLRFAGRQLLVTAQLVDAATEATLWSETLRADRGDVEDIFALQNDIATAIARALGAEITAEDRDRIERLPTASAEAYAHYLAASGHGGDFRFADAMREYDRAVGLDDAFAEAYSRRAVLYAYAQITSNARGQLLSADRRTEEFEALALENSARALALDSSAGSAWVGRALTEKFRFRYAEAREAFARALALSPSDVGVLREYALFHHELGNRQEALSLIRQAERLDPNGLLTLSNLAEIASGAGLIDEARAALDRALALEPSEHTVNVFAALLTPDPAAAERFVRSAEARIGDDYRVMFLPGIATVYRRIGLDEDAERALARYGRWAANEDLGAGDLAQYHLLRGDPDMAYEWLRRAVERIERGEVDAGFIALTRLLSRAETDPALAENRFQDLLGRLEALRRAN